MNSYDVADLKENTYFTDEVVLDKMFLLLNSTIPVTNDLIKALLDWDFRQVYSDGTIGTGIAKSVSAPASASEPMSAADILKFNSQMESVDPEELKIAVGQKKLGDSVKRIMEDAGQQFQDSASVDNEQSRMSMVQTVYNEYLNYIGKVYTHYATHKELNLEELHSTVKDFCVFIKENRRYVLRVEPEMEARSKNFLISHSMRSTVLAITIGLQLRIPLSKLVELGVACILHEIGMIRLPPQLYMTDRMLSPAEKNQINTHPIISYTILKSYDAPLSICLGVLEHHEKENGTGYPRHISGDKISMYAKIISVACSFEAITAPRHYKEASSSYDAMVEMLKNKGKQYDELVIKALLYSLSLFPIGAYVYLSNGKIGQVVDVNPENPKNPIVQIVGEKDTAGDPKTVETNDSTLRVMRVLNKQEVADILKTVGVK
ncbi:HD-GYP domain-containing protein [Treponema brennaborense]|uniref:Metal dependent phosphohydrolase n=1 Tax=Treponema brennaborense (strain DSM 12168 / CIP 105900 / DD5/3) TaxID=906968 RepID=F4LIH5_TREBD|nr:HD-GYP domain-containing protein [Treponema brennaborense]AEE16216.1 metal dependent phosphohydrolase [Treponema brennaborense DSM 12168]